MTNTFFESSLKKNINQHDVSMVLLSFYLYKDLTIQHFANSTTISDEIYIINNKDILQLNRIINH